MSTDREAELPELPKKRVAFFCTKCRGSKAMLSQPDRMMFVCADCNHTSVSEYLDYNDDEMRSYALSAADQREKKVREELEADAMRYRLLRGYPLRFSVSDWKTTFDLRKTYINSSERLDEAIDAARTQGEQS